MSTFLNNNINTIMSYREISKWFILVLLCSACFIEGSKEIKQKIVIDNDAGGDDAMAIFLALLYEEHFNGPQVIGLMTGHGNTEEDQVCINNKRILKIAEREDVPIYRGSNASLETTPELPAYYGKDGLGDNGDDDIADLVEEHKQDAVSALVELSKLHKGELVVITIGTLTNVARAIQSDPGFLGRLAHLFIGAGHIYSHVYNKAEFNARMDVEAYQVIIQNANPTSVTILPFSQCKESLNISKCWRKEVLGAIETDIIKAQNKFERVSMQKDPEYWYALDPATIATAIKSDLVNEYKYSRHDIILHGDRRGINTNEFVNKSEANVRIIYSIKKKEYQQFLLQVFSENSKA